MVVDIPINCSVRLLHLVPILTYISAYRNIVQLKCFVTLDRYITYRHTRRIGYTLTWLLK